MPAYSYTIPTGWAHTVEKATPIMLAACIENDQMPAESTRFPPGSRVYMSAPSVPAKGRREAIDPTWTVEIPDQVEEEKPPTEAPAPVSNKRPGRTEFESVVELGLLVIKKQKAYFKMPKDPKDAKNAARRECIELEKQFKERGENLLFLSREVK